MLKTSQELREEIAASNSKCEAIMAVAREDKRDMSADERAVVNAWHGEGESEGEFAAIEAKLQQAIRIEDRQKQLATPTLVDSLQEVGTESGVDLRTEGAYAKIKVPARARVPHELKSFKPDELSQAYAAGQWYLALRGNEHSKQWCANHGLEVINAGQLESTGDLGGFTVPEPLEAAIIRVVVANGVFRNYAHNKTMTSATTSVPRRAQGVVITFPDEGVKIGQSAMKFGKVKLTAGKYAALAKLSTELNEDSVLDVIDELATEVGIGFAEAEDRNGFLGDGTAAFASTTGLHTALGAESTVTSVATTIAALTQGNYNACQALVPDFTGFMPAWFCNKATYFNSMQPLLLAAGGTTATEVANGQSVPMFLGAPVIFTSTMKRTPVAGESAAFFGDLRLAATIGTRRGMGIKILNELFAAEDMIGVQATKRVAIEVHEVGNAAVAAVAASGDDAAIPAIEASAGPMVKLILS